MTKLHLIEVDGTVKTQEWAGELEFSCPPFHLMRPMIGLGAYESLEHVSVLWQGKRAHMFVDEEGLRKGLLRNERATRIYYNATLARRRSTNWIYSDMAVDPKQQRIDEEPGFFIVGPALLWEGDMD